MKWYPAYKDSEIEYLNTVPQNWRICRLKHASKINPTKGSSGFTGLEEELVTFLPMENVNEDGTFSSDLMKPVKELWKGFTYFEPDDTILAKITPCFENGKGACLTALKNKIGFGSTEFHVLRKIDSVSFPKFLYYLTKSDQFRKPGKAFMTGAAGQKRVPADFIENFFIGLPSYEEQQYIAKYLDHKTHLIDTLIKKKQKQIELLKEQRTAIINHAVTKGVNPNVRMKDSGIEWLGEVPEHWKLLRNFALFEQVDERGYPELPVLQVSINSGVTIREFSEDKIEWVMSDFKLYKRVQKGFIAFNKMRMWQGAVGVAPQDGLVSPDYTVAKPRSIANSEYFAFQFRLNEYSTEVDRHSHGIVKDRNRLYWDGFKQITSLCPPYDEQLEIVDYIKNKTTEIDELLNTDLVKSPEN